MSRRRSSSSLPPSPPEKTKETSHKQLEHQFNYALELFEDGLFEDALEQTRQILAKEDRHYDFWCLEGKIRVALGEEQAAERAFNRAASLAPGLPEPLLHKASFYNHLGRFEDAVQLCEQALQTTDQDDDRQNAYFMLAEAWIGLARQEMTVFMEQVSDEMADLDQDDEPSEIQVPPEIREIYQRGLSMIQKALDIDNSDAELWHLQAGALLELQQIEKAIDSLQKAVEFDDENPEYWHDLGVAYELSQQPAEAQQAYQRLFDLETGEDVEGMEFSRQEFASVVRDVWAFLESEISEAIASHVQIEMTTQDFPSSELLQNKDELFDPWLPLRLEIDSHNPAEPQLRCILYQRNVERESGASSVQDLADYLRYLLEDVLLRTPDVGEDAIEA